MFNLSFSPVRADTKIALEKQGDTLIINGEAFDFTALPEGATLPSKAVNCAWLSTGSVVSRVNGVLSLRLVLPHGANAPEETKFPAAMTVTDDGPVTLPLYGPQTNKNEADEKEAHNV